MINKNPEAEIGVRLEGQKSKIVSHWLLPLPQSDIAILPTGISEWDCVWELFPPILYFSLGLVLKVVYHYRQLTWLLGLKVCVTIALSVKIISVAVLLSEPQASFIY